MPPVPHPSPARHQETADGRPTLSRIRPGRRHRHRRTVRRAAAPGRSRDRDRAPRDPRRAGGGAGRSLSQNWSARCWTRRPAGCAPATPLSSTSGSRATPATRSVPAQRCCSSPARPAGSAMFGVHGRLLRIDLASGAATAEPIPEEVFARGHRRHRPGQLPAAAVLPAERRSPRPRESAHLRRQPLRRHRHHHRQQDRGRDQVAADRDDRRLAVVELPGDRPEADRLRRAGHHRPGAGAEPAGRRRRARRPPARRPPARSRPRRHRRGRSRRARQGVPRRGDRCRPASAASATRRSATTAASPGGPAPAR